MISRATLVCAICVIAIGCGRNETAESSSDVRMEADTISRATDSLMIGAPGAAPMAAEPNVGGTADSIPSAALSDLSASRSRDTAELAKPRKLPEEPSAVTKPD